MRTLALLAAILLLALQAQTEPLRETADEVADQEEPGAEDQDVAVSFDEDKRSALDDPSVMRNTTCYCRRLWCNSGERRQGTCRRNGAIIPRVRCCRREKQCS